MPQVNDVSWLPITLFFFFILLAVLTDLSYKSSSLSSFFYKSNLLSFSEF